MSQEKAQLIAPIGIMTVSGMTATGVITATSFTGNIVGSAKSLVNGTDVTAGVVTATSFVGNLTGNIQRLADSAPNINVGVTTATSFVGNLTGSVTDLTSAPAITVGMVTATTLEGPVTGNVTGNVSGLAGGLGVNYNGGWTGAGTSQIKAGVVTATTFYGDGSNLEGVSSGPVSQQSIGITSASTTIDLSNGNVIQATQSADTTVSFASTSNGNVYFIRIKDDNTTARTITWPDSIKWDGGSAPTLISNSLSGDAQMFLLVTRDMGVTWYGKEVVKYDVLTYEPFVWGRNEWTSYGALGLNDTESRSSPCQIPGQWQYMEVTTQASAGIREKNELWTWGRNEHGQCGLNYTSPGPSSPIQVPGTTWTNVSVIDGYDGYMMSTKSDGTLWAWGSNRFGLLGQNQAEAQLDAVSSPVQVGSGADWTTSGRNKINATFGVCAAVKTDGTLWSWGYSFNGVLGINDNNKRSSPTQIPGTTWRAVAGWQYHLAATKTDGTLWSWGGGDTGGLGLNDTVSRSSPTQVPGTTWDQIIVGNELGGATKTDGTLWMWGKNRSGILGQNQADNTGNVSSPVQVPGTTWASIGGGQGTQMMSVTKTDGTIWVWGNNTYGTLGLNDRTWRSSPTQVPGTWNSSVAGNQNMIAGLKES